MCRSATTNCSIDQIPKLNLVSILLRFRSIISIQIPNLVLILLIFRTIVLILSIHKIDTPSPGRERSASRWKVKHIFYLQTSTGPSAAVKSGKVSAQKSFHLSQSGEPLSSPQNKHLPSNHSQTTTEAEMSRASDTTLLFISQQKLVRSLRGYCFAESSRRADSKYRSAACYLPGIKNQLQPEALGRRRTALWGAGIMQDAQTPA